MALTSHATSSSGYFEFEKECREIHKLWDRPGQLTQALANKNRNEKQEIKKNYKAIYGKDLIDRLHDEIEVPICEALYMWMLDVHERDAIVAREALARSKVDYNALVEIYTRRKSSQLFFTKQAYLTKFRTHLDQDIVSDASTPYQKLLGALATSHRSHHEEVSQHVAKCDAIKLYGAINVSTGGIDEATIVEIFSKRSIPQLRLGFSCYKQIYGHDFTLAMKKKSSGEFENSLKVIITCMCDPFEYYSEMVFKSLKGGAETERLLIRVIMGSVEVGIQKVTMVFEKKHGMKVQKAIESKCSDGDLRDFLLALANVQTS